MPAVLTYNPDDAVCISAEMGSLLELLEDLCLNRGTKTSEEVISAYEEAAIEERISQTFKRRGLHICDEILYRRLRESIERSLVAGYKNCWQEEYVRDVKDSLTFAKKAKSMDCDDSTLAKIDFSECEVFLKHLQALHAAYTKNIKSMIIMFKRVISGLLTLSENVLTAMLRSLCASVEKENATSDNIDSTVAELIHCDIMDVLKVLLLGPETDGTSIRVPAVCQYHIGVQCFGTRLIALVAIAIAQHDDHKERVSKSINIFATKKGAALGKSKFWKASKEAQDLLKRILEVRASHEEHSSVWACLKALKLVCKVKSLCEKFLLNGLLVSLEEIHRKYHLMEELGPPLYERVKITGETQHKPAFVLPPSIRAEEVIEEQEDTSGHPMVSRYTIASEAIKNTSVDPEKTKLLYLLGEEFVIEHDHHKSACDRNFMLLMIKDLKATCEKTRKAMARSFTKS